jgi:hypothetical protein
MEPGILAAGQRMITLEFSEPESRGDFEEPHFGVKSQIFHSGAFLGIFRESKGVKGTRVMILDGTDVIGYFNAFLTYGLPILPPKFQARYTVFSSPVFRLPENSQEVYSAVLPRLDKLIKEQCLFAEWRNTEDPTTYSQVFHSNGWEYQPYRNYLVNLKRDEEAIWRSFDRYARGNITKGKNKGISVRIASPREWAIAYKMISALYQARHIPLFDESVFRLAFEELLPKGNLRATFAVVEEKTVGVRIALLYNGVVLDWFAASDRRYSNFYPNEVLVWEMIRYAVSSGYELFDFGGAGQRGREYGPARFKQKFNGDLVEYGRFRKTHRPALFSTVNFLYEMRKGRWPSRRQHR